MKIHSLNLVKGQNQSYQENCLIDLTAKIVCGRQANIEKQEHMNLHY